MYEKEFAWEYNQIIHVEYVYKNDNLQLVSWKLYKNVLELVPTREVSEEIEIMLANWLEKEYSRNVLNYMNDLQDCMQEKRWEI